MIKVALDFAPGLHGHFLEYVCNRYIFKTPYNNDTIFQSSGAVHVINTDVEYQQNKVVEARHYSLGAAEYPVDTSHVLFIKHNSKFDIVLLTNVFHRCHPKSMRVDDFDVDIIVRAHQNQMGTSDDPAELKCNWYSKLMERHFENTNKQPLTDLPKFEFDYGSFFEFDSFLLELKKTAQFLNHTFSYDKSLLGLWQEFITINQGFKLYRTGNELFIDIAGDIDSPIPNDWKVHAYLNFKISTIFDLHDSKELFGLDPYPTNTKQIYQIVKQHIDNFDNLY